MNPDHLAIAAHDAWVTRQKTMFPEYSYATWEQLTDFERGTYLAIAKAVSFEIESEMRRKLEKELALEYDDA